MNTAAAPLERYIAGELPVLDDAQAETLYAAGFELYEQNEYPRAADVFRLLALARPHATRSWLALAATHEVVGDLERAMALYAIATECRDATDNERGQAFINLARTAHLLGADEDARACLEQALEYSDTLEDDTAAMLSTLEAALGGGRR